MTYSFPDINVTTWGSVDGDQQWRVRGGLKGDFVAHFLAPRDTDSVDLYDMALAALAEKGEFNPPTSQSYAATTDTSA